MSIVLAGSTSGSITLQEPAIAGSNTINLPAATGTAVLDTATQTLTNKTLTTPNINSAQFATVSGTAPIYPCRAWVNFNGTGTPAIRASGNVSSIGDFGTGTYDVNFTTALPDANYSVQANVTDDSTANRGINVQGTFGANQTTSTVRVTAFAVGVGGQDPQGVFVAIFR